MIKRTLRYGANTKLMIKRTLRYGANTNDQTYFTIWC